MVSEKYQVFINKALELFKNDQRFLALALGDSYVTGDMDEFSDLDFTIVIRPDAVEALLEERFQIAESLGDVLSAFTGEHVGVPSLLICLYDNPLLHVDLNFVTPQQAGLGLYDPTILFERESALSAVFSAVKPVEHESKAQWFEDRFWVWVHYIGTKIGRGELFEALAAISFLRETVLGPLILAEKAIFPRGVRFVERDAPEYQAALIETVAAYDKADCVRALKAEIALYRELRKQFTGDIMHRVKAEPAAENYLDEIANHFIFN